MSWQNVKLDTFAGLNWTLESKLRKLFHIQTHQTNPLIQKDYFTTT